MVHPVGEDINGKANLLGWLWRSFLQLIRIRLVATDYEFEWIKFGMAEGDIQQTSLFFLSLYDI